MAPSISLRVSAVQIKNVLGISEVSIEPGKVNVIRGKNGTNKTSIITAIQATLGGGNLAKLARIGADDEPEVVLEISGDDGLAIHRVERMAGRVRVQSRVGQTAAFEDVGQPQGWLSSLFDPAGCNPVAFLTAKDKDRARMLLEALPLHLDREEMGRILGAFAEHVQAIPDGLHPLEELGMVREFVFRARTGVNRDAKNKAGAADQTRRKVPATFQEDRPELIVQLRDRLEREVARGSEHRATAETTRTQYIERARAEHRRADDAISAAFTEAVRGLRADHKARAAEIRAEAERRIAADLAEVEATVTQKREAVEADRDAIETKRDEAIAIHERAWQETHSVLEKGAAAMATLRAEIAKLEERAKGMAAARALAEQADQFAKDAAELETTSAGMTATLANLDAFGRRMAERLPIPGLSIEDKVIRVDGIPFEQLNTAQRVAIAVKIALLRSEHSRLRVLFVDGAEALDREHFDLFCQALLESGAQAFVTKVEDTPVVLDIMDPPAKGNA